MDSSKYSTIRKLNTQTQKKWSCFSVQKSNGSEQAWANPEKFSANPENTDNYFWKMFTNILIQIRSQHREQSRRRADKKKKVSKHLRISVKIGF